VEPLIFDAPPDGWDTLLARDPNATAAHRPALWRAFAATLPMRLAFVGAMGGGALQGGAPVLIERRAGLSWLRALPMLLPAAPLALEGRRAEVDAAVARGIGGLQRRLRVVGGEWAVYRPHDPPPDDTVLAACGGETRAMEAACVDLGGGIEAARGRMDRKTRQDVRRAARHLRFEEAPAALEEAYALYARQARRWGAHRPLPLELSRRLLAGDAPPARLFAVRDARGLLSATLALDGARETMLWWSGSHTEARHRGAFPFLLWSVVEWAAAAGRARVNLGASAGRSPVAEFKASLGARGLRYPVRWLDARYASPAGRVVAALQSRARLGRDRGAA
jgi:hypothetical protein